MSSPRSRVKPEGADAELWHRLVDEFTTPLTGFFAKRIRDRAEVDDLVQDVFVRLLKRSEGAEIEYLRGYVFQVARSVLNDRLRKAQVRHASAHEPFDDVRHGDSDFSPERVYLGKEDLSALIDAVRELPQRTQDVFVLRAFENRKYTEIAAMMKLSVRAIEKHMAKALAHVGRALDRD